MAASRATVLLLGLVVLATLSAAAEAHTACDKCSKGEVLGLPGLITFPLHLTVDLRLCGPSLNVMVEGGLLLADRAKATKRCSGGKVTALAELTVQLKEAGKLVLLVEVLGKDGKAVAKAVVKVNLLDVVLEVSGGVYYVELQVRADPHNNRLLFLCQGNQVYSWGLAPGVFGLVAGLTGSLPVDLGLGNIGH